jgi:predicted nucleic acid-binding protein
MPFDAKVFLDTLAELATSVDIHFKWRGLSPDPGDDMVLEAAVNGGADALVTFNERHLAEAADRFGLALRRPDVILAELRKRP